MYRVNINMSIMNISYSFYSVKTSLFDMLFHFNYVYNMNITCSNSAPSPPTNALSLDLH